MNKTQWQFIQIYLFVVIVVVLALSWSHISWIFNYNTMEGLAYDFFNPYEASTLVTAVDSATEAQAAIAAVKPTYPYSPKANSIEIPAIGITAPIVISQTTDVKLLEKDLNTGVVYYPGSVAPSDPGQIVVLGHSAPPNWPKIKYDWVFSEINSLENGDIITLHFNNTEYNYRVIGKEIVTTEQGISSRSLNGKNNILTIVSCWPPGQNARRIAVDAELIVPEISTQI